MTGERGGSAWRGTQQHGPFSSRLRGVRPEHVGLRGHAHHAAVGAQGADKEKLLLTGGGPCMQGSPWTDLGVSHPVCKRLGRAFVCKRLLGRHPQVQ